MDASERRLYHQIHPLKLATDIGVTPIFLYYLWRHEPIPALALAFIPPLVASTVIMRWTAALEAIKQSPPGRYLKRYITPAVEAVRFLTLVPMAYGAWTHQPTYIAVGIAVLMLAWGYGLVGRRGSDRAARR